MSVTQPAPAAPPTPQPAARDVCPLCGGPLHPEQEWCLKCGAAARTRLAAAPRWKGPVIALVLVIAISLGVLAAALIKLAGESGSSTQASTPTTTVPAAAQPTAGTAATAPAAPTTSTAATVTPPAGTSTPTTRSTAATTTPAPAFGLGAAGAAGAVGARTTPAGGALLRSRSRGVTSK